MYLTAITMAISSEITLFCFLGKLMCSNVKKGYPYKLTTFLQKMPAHTYQLLRGVKQEKSSLRFAPSPAKHAVL